jgi:hypothetical protein
VPEFWQLLPVASPFLYVLYIFLMAGVMRIWGVPKPDIAKWILHQAGRQRFTDLIRAARGLPDAKPTDPPRLPSSKRDEDSPPSAAA